MKIFKESRYLVFENNVPSFIVKKGYDAWVAYDATVLENCNNETDWAVSFKTKKELLDWAYEGKKLTCKRIKY